MPITSIESYRPTTLAFYDNWGDANVELANEVLPSGEQSTDSIILAGNYDREAFGDERDALLTEMDTVQSLALAFRTKADERDTLKVALAPRVPQFRFALQAQIADASIRKRAPQMPGVSSDITKFTKPLKKIAEIWAEINANLVKHKLSAPLTLQGNYTLAQLLLDIKAVELLADESGTAENALNRARGILRAKRKAIYERMKQYRAGVQSKLPKSSPARQNMPRLTPLPGTTPPPLTVMGAWDAQLGKARLTWDSSTADNVSKLQVRGCTGGTYRNDEEDIIADLPPDATSWEGTWGLNVPGTIASFKVYVMTTTENENGGKPVKIVRPMPQL